jgi:hypothetical protein
MKIFPAALFIFLLTLCITNPIISQDDSRWQLTEDGGIEWLVSAGDSHMDHIEISGFHISSIVRYGVDDGQLKQSVHLVFPMLRTIPNDTHASLSHDFTYGNGDRILINGKMINEKPERFYIRGILSYRSLTSEGIEITHYLFPSTDKPLFIDRTVIRNKTDRPVSIELTGNELTHITDTAKGVYGAYRIRRYPTRQGLFTLNAGECLNYAIVCSAYKA